MSAVRPLNVRRSGSPTCTVIGLPRFWKVRKYVVWLPDGMSHKMSTLLLVIEPVRMLAGRDGSRLARIRLEGGRQLQTHDDRRRALLGGLGNGLLLDAP